MAKKKKTGRPLVEIDKEQFERLCIIQPTLLELCAVFDVDKNTLMSWCKRTYKMPFSEIFAQKRAKGKISLRRSLWQGALEEKNTVCRLFLAKNHLGMSDMGMMDDSEENELDLNFFKRENV